MAMWCSSTFLALPSQSKPIPFRTSSIRPANGFSSLNFSSSVSGTALLRGTSLRPLTMSSRRPVVFVATANKKPDSAEKRARQAEKRRIYNKSRKSEIKTRMKKVFESLAALKSKAEPNPEDLLPVEKQIGEAYSVIDKAVKVGTLHRNTGAHRKSRLARRKKAVEIHHGWYKPVTAG